MITLWNARAIRVAAIVLLVGAVIGRYFLTYRPTPPTADYRVAERGNIVVTVSVSGKITPAQRVDLAFEHSGIVRRVWVNVGASVKAGQPLIRLDQTELRAQLAQSQAGVASAQARLEEAAAGLENQQAKFSELKQGTRSEAVAIKQAELRQAQQELTNVYATVPNTLSSALTKADDAVRVKTSALYARTQTTYQLTYQTCDAQAESDATWQRYLSETTLTTWHDELNRLPTNAPALTLNQAVSQASNHITQIRRFLERTHDTLTIDCTRNDPNLQTYRANLSLARDAVVAALGHVNALEQTVAAKERVIERILSEVSLTVAGPQPEQLNAQAAVVKQAEAAVLAQAALVQQARANLHGVQAQLAKTILNAPLAGVVTVQAAKVGQSVTPNAPLVSLITADQLEIIAHVPEADIASLTPGQAATLTLDAYGDEAKFFAAVAAIDPAETIIDSVPTYRVTLHFTQTDPRPKSGMTANLEIVTARREQIVLIPSRAVTADADGAKVRLRNPDGTTRTVQVKTGLRSTRGEVEIISGITPGDFVVMTLPE